MYRYAAFMQSTQTPTPAPSAASFASLLTALATPAPKPDAEWNDEALPEDVATLSYERALRSHSRYRSADPIETAAAQLRNDEENIVEFAMDEAPMPPMQRGRTVPPEAFARAHEAAQAELAERAAQRTPTPFERNLKNASITIRMSKAEADQLHRRAAEAGLTVSAYLRSCTFEVESLRAMVKDTVAQLRAFRVAHADGNAGILQVAFELRGLEGIGLRRWLDVRTLGRNSNGR